MSYMLKLLQMKSLNFSRKFLCFLLICDMFVRLYLKECSGFVVVFEKIKWCGFHNYTSSSDNIAQKNLFDILFLSVYSSLTTAKQRCLDSD